MATTELAQQLRRLVSSCLAYRKAMGLSPATLYADEHRLRRFVSWVETERPTFRSLADIDKGALDDYAIWLTLFESEDGHRLKASSRHGHLIIVGTFFTWLYRRGRILQNPALDLPLPRIPQELPKGLLTFKEVNRVLKVPDLKTMVGLRDRAVLELLYSTGIRNAELRALKVQDLNFAEGLVTVQLGKGAKDRVVPMGKTAAHYLEIYLDRVRPYLRRSKFEEHVFLSRYGKSLSKTQLIRDMEGIGKKAGLKKPLTCHGLRHSCATHMLKGRADIRHIQELLGHRSLNTTQIYTQVAITDLRKVHARCHPREKGRV